MIAYARNKNDEFVKVLTAKGTDSGAAKQSFSVDVNGDTWNIEVTSFTDADGAEKAFVSSVSAPAGTLNFLMGFIHEENYYGYSGPELKVPCIAVAVGVGSGTDDSGAAYETTVYASIDLEIDVNGVNINFLGKTCDGYAIGLSGSMTYEAIEYAPLSAV